jgi:hypothetical protein
MDVRIGVTHTAKELHLELGDDADRDKLIAEIDAAVLSDTGMLWLTDRKGRKVGLPAAKVAYVEIGSTEAPRVGFGSR